MVGDWSQRSGGGRTGIPPPKGSPPKATVDPQLRSLSKAGSPPHAHLTAHHTTSGCLLSPGPRVPGLRGPTTHVPQSPVLVQAPATQPVSQSQLLQHWTWPRALQRGASLNPNRGKGALHALYCKICQNLSSDA